MLKKLWRYLNPMIHLGEKKYPLLFPFLTTLTVYTFLEIFGFFIWKHPDRIGNLIIFSNFALILYFSFRSAIKGGLIVLILSIVYYIYYLSTRQALLVQKEMAATVAGLLSVTNLLIVLLIGWHRKTIDDLLYRETQARIAAEKAEIKFRTIADSIPILCWMAHSDGSIFWYNKRWYEYTGISPKQMKGWDWKSVHDPKILPQVLKSWNASIKTGKSFEMVFPLKGADGNYRQFLTRIVPVRNNRNRITYWFGSNTDITEQKEIEQRKDDFIGMVSHELRTPITTAKIYSQVAFKESLHNDHQVKILGKVNDQLDKLKNLIDTMLDTARFDQGKMLLPNEEFTLAEVAIPTIASLQDTTNHTLTVDWQTSEYLYGNKEKIAQVFTNLISNAIKFSPDSKEIIIKSQKKNHSVVISVQDFGVGLSNEEQKHIFDRYYQSKDHKTYPGLGLGLFLSKEIIKKYHGKIWVESEKGKGSTFYFSLPVYKNN